MALRDSVFYVNYGNGTSTGYYAGTKWATGTTTVCGNIVRQNAAPSVGNERFFVCIASTSGTGTTNATTEPTWTVTRGAKNTDNTVTWQECTGNAALNGDLTNTLNWNSVKNTAVTLGQVIQNVAGTLILICTTAGTCGNSSEPSWASFTNAGATTADNSATWTTLGASFSQWGTPHARINNALSTTIVQSGTTIYVASAHAETQSAVINWNVDTNVGAPVNIICVNAGSGNTPPLSTDVTTGATVTSTGAYLDLATGAATAIYLNGVSFTCSGGGTGIILCDGNFSWLRIDNSTLSLTGATSADIYLGCGYSTGQSYVELNNVVCSFSNSGQGFIPRSSTFKWRNTASALTGTSPTTLFISPGNGPNINATIEGVDISSFAGTIFNGGCYGEFILKNCKLNSGVTIGTPVHNMYIDTINCDSGTEVVRNERHGLTGTITTSTQAARTNGATDGTTPYSFNLVPSSSSLWNSPLECWPVAIWNSVTGSNVTVTWYGVYNGAALPNNDQIWGDVEYNGSASSPLLSLQTGTKSNILDSGSALTADTSAWDTAATARANSHSYSIGDIISVSSNSGRIFFCTSGGMSASSLPGGYASAVDGGTVTDSGATFRAGMRFSQTITLSSPQPQINAYVYITVKAALASASFFVDPLVVL